MYEEYFGLTEKPFQITPDPRFLYLSRRHRDGFAHLLYGTDEAGGFVLLTGEVGTGKTTLCRSALANATEGVRLALILNPKQTPQELVASICDELQVSYPKNTRSLKVLIDKLNLFLLRAYGEGQRIVVVIDEAQNLAIEVLEQVRLLTNLEVSTQKLLQIILIGQPELSQMLDKPELRQLAQRVTARFHLTPLTKEETAEYIVHRLKIAGVSRQVFSKSAIQKVFHYSNGIPRLINTLCERSLIGAYAHNLPIIKPDVVSNAAKEVLGREDKTFSGKSWAIRGTAVIATLVMAFGIWKLSAGYSKSTAEMSKDSRPQTESVQQDSRVKPVVVKQTTPADIAQEMVPSKEASLSDANLPLVLDSSQANTTSAFTNLFALWQRDYATYSGETGCTRANNAGMRCIFGQGTLETLLQYNRPAIIELKNQQGRLLFAVLKEVDKKNLVLDVEGATIPTTAQELAQYWTGNFIVFWQPPFPANERLAKGFSGPDVLWLRHQLDRIEGQAEAEYSDKNLRFDEQLASRVTAFQSQYGLKADGIVGRETFIALANKANSGEAPRLQINTNG